MKKKTIKRISILIIAAFMCIFNISTCFAQSPKGYVTISVEKFTLRQGYIKEPVKVPFYEGDSVAHLITRLLGSGNYTNTGSVSDTSGTVKDGFYLASVRDGGGGGENIPQYILEQIKKDDKEVEYSRLESGFLGEFDYTNMSGWMYCVNNWFPNYGSSVYFPKDGDVIRWQFTVYGYGMDIGGGMINEDGTDADNFQGAYRSIANKDELTEKVAEINSSSDRAKLLSNSKVRQAYDNAYDILQDLETTQSEQKNALKELNNALENSNKPEKPNENKPETPGAEKPGESKPEKPNENKPEPEKPNENNPETPNTTVVEEKIIGNTRYETAVKVSKNGWDNANNIVIVNGDKLPDALAATPFAKQKDAPILLTTTNKLDDLTREEIKRLKAQNAFIIGGEGVVSNKVKSQLEQLGLKVERIAGKTRFETSLAIANKMSSVSQIAVVNGETGLSDATSIAAVAAVNNMPIILMPTKGTNIYDTFIKNKNIKKSYVIGQVGSISKAIESKLPNAERIGGADRNETNAKVITKFYDTNKIDNMFICKNGSKKQSELIDALSVGALAAKGNSPVLIVGDNLNNSQINIFKFKEVRKLTQVGGGSEKAFNQIKGIYKK